MTATWATKFERAGRRALRRALGRPQTPSVTERSRVGTFHKSGSMLWWNILKDLEAREGLRVWYSSARRWFRPGRQPEPAAGWDVEYHFHSQFRGVGAPGRTPPTLIVVRDPRDIVISAAKYHCWSGERWLSDPAFALDEDWRRHGRTYQEAIRSLADDKTRILFEMRNATGRAIRSMIDTVQNTPNLMTVKLEALMADRDLQEFRACFAWLGFRDAMLERALDVARRHSVFSEGFRRPAHVQSGAGGQWVRVFDDELLAAFESRFGDAPARLGYVAGR